MRDLSVAFKTDDGILHAVDKVSFDVHHNETLGIVGESGSGKSVTSMAILGLLPKSAKITGEVLFRGEQVLGLPEKQLEKLRGSKIAMVFQDALAALNPVQKVGKQIEEAIAVHQDLSGSDRRAGDRAARDRGHPEPDRSGSTSTRTSTPAACGSGR